MFEATRYLETCSPEIEPTAVKKFQNLRDSIVARSLIVWGEHCSECSAPACYSTCGFYTPRHEDLNCSRFADGIRKGMLDGNLRIATIQFRKWGKLEGKGPARLVHKAAANRWEYVDDIVAKSISKFVPSPGIRRLKWQWDQAKQRYLTQGDMSADAFVVEAWLPTGARAESFTLTIIPVEDSGDGLFQDKIQLEAGYNLVTFPMERIQQRVDLAIPFFVKIEPLSDALSQDITFGLVDFVKFKDGHQHQSALPIAAPNPRVDESSEPASPLHPKIKCVIWDLDNTLWHGTLAEDGPEALRLNPQVSDIIRELDRRGILQSIASKNDIESVTEVLKSFGLAEYFLYPQVNWNPKSSSVQKIAELLDIGLDTLVLIDDQPFERAEVCERLPSVRVLSDTEIPHLLGHPWLDVPITEESGSRRAMYQAEQLRKAIFQESPGDYLEFLQSCFLKVEVSELHENVLERAYELSQRTNQLNVSGQRYEKDELRDIMQAEDPRQALVFRCSDRFGDYGHIAMCVFDRKSAEIESFMMSCRVQRKKVENAIFAFLAEMASRADVRELRVRYHKKPRNGAAVIMLEELGFTYEGTEDTGYFKRNTDIRIADSTIVSLIETAMP